MPIARDAARADLEAVADCGRHARLAAGIVADAGLALQDAACRRLVQRADLSPAFRLPVRPPQHRPDPRRDAIAQAAFRDADELAVRVPPNPSGTSLLIFNGLCMRLICRAWAHRPNRRARRGASPAWVWHNSAPAACAMAASWARARPQRREPVGGAMASRGTFAAPAAPRSPPDSLTIVPTAARFRLLSPMVPDGFPAKMAYANIRSAPSPAGPLAPSLQGRGAMGAGAGRTPFPQTADGPGSRSGAWQQPRPTGVMQARQSGNRTRRRRWTATPRRKKPRPLALENLPGDQPGAFRMLVALIDPLDLGARGHSAGLRYAVGTTVPRMCRRPGRAFHRRTEIAGGRPGSCRTLQGMAKETGQIRRMPMDCPVFRTNDQGRSGATPELFSETPRRRSTSSSA